MNPQPFTVQAIFRRRVINKNAQTSLSIPITKCETIYGSTTKKINNGLKQDDDDLKILKNKLNETPNRAQTWNGEWAPQWGVIKLPK